jgi:hypothetical protein
MRRAAMSEIYRALVDIELYGNIGKDDQNLHELVLYGGETYELKLDADDNKVNVDLYVTDEDDNMIFKVEDPGATLEGEFTPEADAVFRFFVKAINGNTDYVLRISERD